MDVKGAGVHILQTELYVLTALSTGSVDGPGLQGGDWRLLRKRLRREREIVKALHIFQKLFTADQGVPHTTSFITARFTEFLRRVGYGRADPFLYTLAISKFTASCLVTALLELDASRQHKAAGNHLYVIHCVGAKVHPSINACRAAFKTVEITLPQSQKQHGLCVCAAAKIDRFPFPAACRERRLPARSTMQRTTVSSRPSTFRFNPGAQRGIALTHALKYHHGYCTEIRQHIRFIRSFHDTLKQGDDATVHFAPRLHSLRLALSSTTVLPNELHAF